MHSTPTTILTALAIATAASADITINEIRTGTGNAQYVEFRGNPGDSLAGMTFLIIGDGTTGGANPTKSGCVEWIWTFDAGAVIGPNGTLVLHNPGQNPAQSTDTGGPFPFAIDPATTNVAWTYQASGLAKDTQFETGKNQTYMLVTGFSGTDTYVTRAPSGGNTGQDLDTNDDGFLDLQPWNTIVDWVSVKQSGGSSPSSGQVWWYAPTVAGPATTRTLVYPVQPVMIAGWDFQTTTNANGGTAAEKTPNTPRVFNSNGGAGTMYLDGTNGSSDWIQGGELDALQGSSLNTTVMDTNGNVLDPTITSKSGLCLVGTTANNKSVTFRFSMTGRVGLNISYATRASSSTGAFTTQTWQYSTDGSTWTNIPSGAITGFTTSFATKTIPAFAALDGAASAYVRCTFAGATGATTHHRIDNVVFHYNVALPPAVQLAYAAPVHAFRTASGKWAVGQSSTAAGTALDTVGAANPAWDYTCGDAAAGASLTAHWNPCSSDACCCAWICGNDAFCCQVSWDAICAGNASGCASQCSAACPSDLNGDHAVDGADLGLLLGAWGGCASASCVPDINHDGTVDGADLGLLLGAWGACP